MNSTAILIAVALLFSLSAHSQDIFTLDETYTMSATGTIKLYSEDAKVTIRGADRKDVHVNIYRKVTSKGVGSSDRSFKVEVSESDGNLNIVEKSRSSGWNVGYQREEYTIEIEAPRGVSLDIDGEDDDYNISGVDGSITMEIEDGDIYISDCGGERFAFYMEDGDLEMDQGAGSLKIDIEDGDVIIENGDFSSVDAGLEDGDIALTTALASSGEYNIISSDGSIELNLTRGGGTIDIRHEDARISTDGDFNLTRKEEDRTILKMEGGNAMINLRVEDARVRLIN